jgi:hypothetical protein
LSTARSDRRPIDPVIVDVLAPRKLSLFVSAALVKEDSDENVLFVEVSVSLSLARGHVRS